jgi:hypothetical protein
MGFRQTTGAWGMTAVMAFAPIVVYHKYLAGGKLQGDPDVFVVSIIGSGGISSERQDTTVGELISVSPVDAPWPRLEDAPPFRVR